MEEKQLIYASGIWKEQAAVREKGKTGQPVIIIDENEQFYFQFVKKWNSSSVFYIRLGKYYEQKENCIQIDKSSPRDYVKALKAVVPKTSGRFILICNMYGNTGKMLIGEEDTYLRYVVESVVRIAKAVIRTHPEEVSFYYLYSGKNNVQSGIHSAFTAFGKCLELEQPNIHMKTIGIFDEKSDLLSEWDRIIHIVGQELKAGGQIHEIRYDSGKRLVKKFFNLKKQSQKKQVLRQGGVYVITGGAGGVGYFIAEYLAGKYHAHVILAGRRKEDQDIRQKLEKLSDKGACPYYIQTDVCQRQEVFQLIDTSRKLCGKIDGIFHCAGVLRDGYFILKTEESFLETVKPKVLGAIYLSQAVKEDKIDFMVLFSSITSLIGNTGQTDYGFGNAFLDAFAYIRNRLVKQNECYGKTVSVNWTLWKNGNMNLPEKVQNIMEEKMGILPMNSEDGIQLLEGVLVQDESQIFAAAGNLMKISNFLGIEEKEEGDIEKMHGKRNDVRKFIEDWLISVFSKVTRFDKRDIELEDSIVNYGMDSLIIGKLNEELTKKLGSVSSTLFYEYDTLSELADFMEQKYGFAFEGEKSDTIAEAKLETECSFSEVKLQEETARYSDDTQEKENVFSKLSEYIKEAVAEATGYSREDIDEKESFDNYGMDSSIISTIVQKISDVFGAQSSTILYEYTSVQELAEYLYESYEDKAKDIFGNKELIKEKEPVAAEKVFLGERYDLVSEPMETEIFKAEDDRQIAIIGVSGRFPEAEDLKQFYENLINGKDCITPIPEERWNMEKYLKSQNDIIKWGGFISDVDKFDPLFFNISPVQALIMDPQERLLLEEVWHAMEDAGITRANMKKSDIGVYVGAMYYHYQLLGVEETLHGNPIAPSPSSASIANRISYHFDFHGPSITFDTMCSSALTALHYACESIRNHEIDMAVAAGVNLSIHPSKYLFLNQANFLASDGRCRSFGKDGDGYVPGEGVGAVILKSLPEAIRDKDRIYGVIRSSVLNHGGKTSGYTVPSPVYQGNAIEGALKKADINPRTISCIEAHGTGTSMGDPIEMTGLTRAFGKYTNDKQFCSIGSVKSNIGHLESASGMASVVKVLLQMKYKQLFPSIYGKPGNPNITFSETPFYLQTELAEWKKPVIIEGGIKKEYPRIAGISSFGAGGSNAHVIMEEFIENGKEQNQPINREKQIFVLSAQNKERLKEYVQEYVLFLKSSNSALCVEKDKSQTQIILKQILQSVLAMEDMDIDFKDSILDYVTDPVLLEKIVRKICLQFHIPEPDNKSLYFEESISRLAERLSCNDAHGYGQKRGEQQVRTDISLMDMVYTLQCRREPMQERMAVCVSSLEELNQKLVQFLHGGKEEQGIYTGNIHEDKNKKRIFEKEAEEPNFMVNILRLQDMEKLCKFWVCGTAINWNSLYTEKQKPVSLPLYPFAKERYWITDMGNISDEVRIKQHPLLDGIHFQEILGNGLTLKKRIKENEMGVSYDDVYGQFVLSNSTMTEFIYTVICGLLETSRFYISDFHIKNDIQFQKTETLYLSIKPEEQHIAFQIYLEDSKPIGSGKVFEIEEDLDLGQFSMETYIEKLDEVTESLPEQMKRNRVLKKAYAGHGEAAAAYQLFSQGNEKWNLYFCHPAVLEEILNLITMQLHRKSGELHLESIDCIEIAKPVEQSGFFYLIKDGLKWNAVVADSQGAVTVKLYGIQVRERKDELENLLYQTCWEYEPDPQFSMTAQDRKHVLIIYSKASGLLARELLQQHSTDQSEARTVEEFLERDSSMKTLDMVYYLGLSDELPIDREGFKKAQNGSVEALLMVIQKLDSSNRQKDGFCLKVISNNVYHLFQEYWNPLAAGMNGMLRSVVKEYDGLRAVYFDIDIREDMKATASMIRKESAGSRVSDVLIRNRRRYVKKMYPARLESSFNSAFRMNGVYIILGGMGTIGHDLAKYLLSRYKANVFLIGRSQLDEAKRKKIENLTCLDGNVKYYSGDITKQEDMERIFQEIKECYGAIHGVFHSAVDFHECQISQLTVQKLKAEGKSKTEGIMVLHKVLKQYRPDFVLFFSSGQSFIANPSRASYAAASCFEDAYALYMREQEEYTVQIINWGFWGAQEGYDQKAFQNMLDSEGVKVLSFERKMQIIESIAASNASQVYQLNVKEFIKKLIGASSSKNIRVFKREPDVKVLEQSVCVPETEMMEKAQQILLQLVQKYLLKSFQDAGYLDNQNFFSTLEEYKRKIGVIPQYDRLFEAIIDILERAGYIAVREQSVRVLDYIEREELARQIDDLLEKLRKYEMVREQVPFIEMCAKNVISVLSGKTKARDFILPSETEDMMRSFYKQERSTLQCSQNMCLAVLSYIQNKLQFAGSEKIRILEIESGTGENTQFLLDAIKDYGENIEYVYTDSSESLLIKGKEQFARKYPFTSFQNFDIENVQYGHEMQSGSYDIVIAANVLYAARNIRKTVQNIKKLLKTNGYIILNERNQKSDIDTLTFGLIDTWWKYQDVDERMKNSPLLSVEMWKNLLMEEGYMHPSAMGESLGRYLPENVIAAQSNGVVVYDEVKEEEKIESSSQMTVSVEAQKRIQTNGSAIKKIKGKKLGLKEKLAGIFSDVLMMPREKLNEKVSFADIGVDSILIGNLVTKIEEVLKIIIDPTVLMDHDTLEKLTAFFEKEYDFSEKEKDDERQVIVAGLFDDRPETVPKADIPRKRNESNDNNILPAQQYHDKVAVIGIGCHYPGSRNRQQFWENLKNGTDCITEVPNSRWDIHTLYSPEYEKGKSISKWGGFIDGIEDFDPEYFDISPETASEIDPLIRQMLEVSVETIRDAGYTKEDLYGSNMGVYIGSRSGLYGSRIKQPSKTTILGIGQNFIAAHLSHFYNFTGPSYVIDAACSSSLVSLHNAVNGILSGDCKMAIAGGVDILLDETQYLILSESRAISPEGRCFTFDEHANGFVPGEGCGAVLLKSLEHAIKDGDKIYAVVEASAINNDGHTMGITTPNPNAQAEVIQKALSKAGVPADTVGYVETHGTATLIGDPIELKALDRIFRRETAEKRFCGVGSVKTNIGHLLSAAGIASFSKVCLMLNQKQIPPTLHCATPNPRFHFADSPFYITEKLEDFSKRHGVRRAGISSFGFGGTNVHMILSEPGIYLPEHYQQKRESLPGEVFHKKRYWLEKESICKQEKKEEGFNSFLEFRFAD